MNGIVNGSIVARPPYNKRICSDYKVTINPVLEVDRYPLPTPEDLFATVSGAKYFSKLDLSHTYQQVELEPKSRKLVTVSTHRGLYQYNRLLKQTKKLLSNATGKLMQFVVKIIYSSVYPIIIRFIPFFIPG